MVLKRIVVVVVALALVAVAIGVGYLLMAGGPSVTPPGAAPKVTSTSPLNGATGTPINGKVIATFSKAMNPSTITTSTFTVKHGAVAVPGTVTYAGTTATFTPSSNLALLTAHSATITTGAKDTSGQALAANYAWTFTTGSTVDNSAPLVSYTSPAPGATGTPVNTKILATFSKAMDASTVSAATFTLKHGATAATGTVTLSGTTATFVPSASLLASTAYTATITTGAKDSLGHALASNFAWSFTTGQGPDTAAPRVSFTSPAAGATGTAVNSQVLATFSEAMDPSTLTDATFTLKQGTSAVSGAVTYGGTTATFVPSSNLAASSAFTATISTGAKDLAGNALGANFVWSFTTGTGPDTTAPRVSFTSPAAASTGVPVNTQVLATFSKAMDPSTVTTATFTLHQGATSVQGTVSYAGTTATFVPSASLSAGSAYTATITTGARDLAGNALQVNFVWSFATGQGPDAIPPQVTSTSPPADATGVALNSDVLATFSEAMDPSTVTVSSFSLAQGTTPVSGLVSYAGQTATFNTQSDFSPDTLYTAAITTSARDLAGNALQANAVWSFRTGQTVDPTPPTVTSTSPASGAVDAAVSADVSATFSEAMDPSTITVSSFALMQGTAAVSGLVSYAGLTATFDPASNLFPATTYTATLTTGARDLAGNAIQSAYSWSFTTSASACGQSAVALGLSGGFAVLAGSTVTNTGLTQVTGDLGASPGTEVTGFPPGTVVGVIHAGDPAAVGGLADLTTAYNDAMGRTLCAITVDGNLGGMTLAPGLYKSQSSLEVSSGDLTLDAQGDANAVFIFQMGSTLTTTIGRQVILTGGAQAKNIFWQVGSSATLGVNSSFVGTILADQSITLTTGAVLDGRALARIGAVTLDANTVTKPAA